MVFYAVYSYHVQRTTLTEASLTLHSYSIQPCPPSLIKLFKIVMYFPQCFLFEILLLDWILLINQSLQLHEWGLNPQLRIGRIHNSEKQGYFSCRMDVTAFWIWSGKSFNLSPFLIELCDITAAIVKCYLRVFEVLISNFSTYDIQCWLTACPSFGLTSMPDVHGHLGRYLEQPAAAGAWVLLRWK